MSAPRVSVILPTFNRAHLLPRAIDSVVAQSMADWELILVDDGSVDATADVAYRYARKLGSKMTYLTQENRGASAARNLGIDHARGPFVAFLDSDDEYVPRKLARQLELFEKRPNLGLVYCDSAFTDLEGRRYESVFERKTTMAYAVPFDEIAPGLRVCRGSLFDWLLQEYFVSTICGIVRRELLTADVRFPVGQAYAEEWLFYLQVARVAPAGYVNEPLCLHHYTAGSLARTDRRTNHVALRSLLLRIRDSFVDLNPRQRRVLSLNLANCHRQLGYDSYRDRRYKKATRHFLASFRDRPEWRTLSEAAQAGLCALLAKSEG